MAAVLSERLQQLRSCASREAAEEALAVFAPLANRRGVRPVSCSLHQADISSLWHPSVTETVVPCRKHA